MIHAKNCLILEDNPARYPYLINQMFVICYPLMERLIITTTAKAAKEELSKQESWNVIMLDHDLDGQVFVNPENFNTGYQVCKYIIEKNIKFELCIIHTLNDYVVKKMMDCLNKNTVGGKVIYKPCLDL